MRTAKRIITASLTAIMIFQALAPSTEVFAQELDAAWNGSIVAAHRMNDAVEGVKSAIAQFAEDVSENSAADTADAEPGDSTQGDTDDSQSGAQGGTSTDGTTLGEDDANGSDSEATGDDAGADVAAQDEDEAASTVAGAQFTLEQLKAVLSQYGSSVVEDDGNGHATQILISQSKGLVLLSNADPSVYQNAAVTVSGITGNNADLTLSAEVVDGENAPAGTYVFQGFGSRDVPFEGAFRDGSGNSITMTSAATLFNGIKLTESNCSISVIWKGATNCQQPIIADEIDGNGQVLDARVAIEDIEGTMLEATAGVSSALLGSVSGALALKASYNFKGKRKGVIINASSGNAGLLVNTLTTGASLAINEVSGLGAVADAPSITTTADGSYAGGLIGYAGEGSTVSFDSAVDVSKFTVKGKAAAGGIIGRAEKVKLNISDSVTLKPALSVGDTSTVYAGGAIGAVSFAENFTVKGSMFDFGDGVKLAAGSATDGVSPRAGGLFGSLDLKYANVTIEGGDYKSFLVGGADIDKARGSYGGVVGIVYDSGSEDNAALPTLTFAKDASNEKVKTSITREKSGDSLPTLRYIGGAVGYIGSSDSRNNAAAVVFDGIEITCKGENYANAANGKFGGVVGVISGSSVIDAKDVKVKTTSNIGSNSYAGAGLIGSSWRAIVQLSGTTDLSEATFNASNAAQLIYEDWSSLVFATGSGSDNDWTYKRPNSAVAIDDIDSYGEVLRLPVGGKLSSDLFTLDEGYNLSVKGGALTIADNNTITLSSADDYAKLALAIQAYGQFPTVNGITYANKNVDSVLGAKINVAGDIDLTGTGLGGLMKDGEPSGGTDGVNETLKRFTGTLTGTGSINLAIGEPFGFRNGAAIGNDDSSDGNGEIYRHTRLGLFNQVEGATFENVTVGGTMRFDDKHGSAVDAGALAARKTGGAATVDNVTVKTEMKYDCTGNNPANIGGMFGQVVGGSDASIAFEDSSNGNAIIKSRDTDVKNARVGGVIGFLSGAETVTVEAAGMTIGGQISLKSNAQLAAGGFIGQIDGASAAALSINGLTIGNSGVEKDFVATAGNANARILAGGLVGYIAQGTTGTDPVKTVNISDLSYSNFAMETSVASASGDNGKSSGGLLGYSWGNTELLLKGNGGKYALSTGSALLTATGATGVGGLIYAASGCWTVDEYAIDLSKMKISAPVATKLGLLVCRGGTRNDGSSPDRVGIDYLTGLYIKNIADWETAYQVNTDDDAISADKVTVFDEWMADGCRSGKPVDDCGTNGVVSLHTKSDKLDMSADPAKRNSYENRTKMGQSKTSNVMTRYYYNLDRAYDEVAKLTDRNTSGNAYMSTPEELLLWDSYQYAPAGVRQYIADPQWKLITEMATKYIGQADNSSAVSIDLRGYSFYPVDYSSGDINISNAKITLHYGDISAEEQPKTGETTGNKNNAQQSQHANMHAGLLRNFMPDSSANKTIKVSNLTFSGTIGVDVLNGGSGALVCKRTEGISTGSRIAGVSINGLVLDGLKVANINAATNGVAPLLVNSTKSYTSLEVKHLSTNEGTYKNDGKYVTAASSLFGSMGDDTADMVTVRFSEGIDVPSKKDDTIFTHASLLESFGYGDGKTGTATYIFYKKDETADGYGVTYGKEIDSKDSEWVGKQYWYYDSETHGKDVGLVTDGSVTADAGNPQFGDYLPYVYTRNNKTNLYHEIKVNHYTANLIVGCGTYGDPFTLSDASEVYAATDYIRSGQPIDGWKITIAKSQNDSTPLCTRRADNSEENEITYTYDASKGAWVATNDGTSVTLYNTTMHLYMQSAYYSIEPKDTQEATNVTTIELDGDQFGGFGNETNPFRGVIVGNLKNGVASAKLKITKGKNSLQGLIPYSYGSVVKDLAIEYAGGENKVAYAGKNENAVPKAFFGGVIGCIVGGDNIIDGVTVGSSEENEFTVAGTDGTGEYSGKGNLVPIGGYVGAIAGGGVIFRGMEGQLASWRSETATDNKLYDNPYVGRVIDGYAFSEFSGDWRLDNGNENYKISNLNTSDTGCVETTGTRGKYDSANVTEAANVKVNSAQGLLVLSAIINSGAAAGSAHTDTVNPNKGYGTFRGSLAYQGYREQNFKTDYQFGNENYGKVRNASYSGVGKGTVENEEWKKAKCDDLKAPGTQEYKGPLDNVADSSTVNSPYLVRKYANWETGYICANKMVGIKLEFSSDCSTYDLIDYGNGYLGLSGRYYSNACVAEASTSGTNRYFIAPFIACIDGNNATLKVSRNVKEYTNDDYRVSGVGGLFDYITYTGDKVSKTITDNEGYSVRNLSFDGCNLSLNYCGTDGSPSESQNGDMKEIGVGCLAGVTASKNDQSSYGKYKNVQVKNGSRVTGVAVAGGMLGSAGYRKMLAMADSTASRMVENNGVKTPVKLVDCSLTGSTVVAQAIAGGLVGKAANGDVTVDASNEDVRYVNNSTIKATKAWAPDGETQVVAGGIIGLSGVAVKIGESSSAANRVVVRNATVTSDNGENTFENSRGIGGLVGRAETTIAISHATVESTKKSSEEGASYIGAKNGTQRKGINTSGKRYGEVGGMVGNARNQATFVDCKASNLELAAFEHSGAILGYLSTANSFTADGTIVDGIQIDGTYSGGVLGGSIAGSNVTISDSKVVNSTFNENQCGWKDHPCGMHSYNGGFVGDAKGTFRLINILLSENEFKEPKYQGQLFGDTNGSAIAGIYVAGVSVKLKTGQTANDVPKMMHFETPATDGPAVKKKTYIAFADYKDTSTNAANHVDGGSLYSDESDGVSATEPYVTTSPVSNISVSTDGADGKSLFGDGVTISTAKDIQNDLKNSASGKYLYDNTGGTSANGAYQTDNAYDPASSESTFNANNTSKDAEGGALQLENDFRVLLIPGNDTTTVTNYLNVITNGGFSDAVRFNGNTKSSNSHVTAQTQTFTYDSTSKKFVKSDTSSLSVIGNGTKSMSFRASSEWDNDKHRFTLLTVTFKEGDRSYKVQVPIVVKRMLEIDFTATFVNGTEFKSSEYDNCGADYHTLISFGDAMTGYLTWTYNEAKGESTEYGWDTYLESGAAMGPLGKRIRFAGKNDTMPQGTQLTLVDTAHNNREYHYTVGEGGTSSVALTDFVADDGQTHYAEQWLSEVMGVTAKEDNSGAWVVCDSSDSNAGAKVGDTYYRPYKEGDKGERFKLAVAKDGDGKEKTQSESVYLVVRVPQGASSEGINGYIATSFDDTGINKNINYTLRTNGRKYVDGHENTASTYSVYSSYVQDLADNADNGIVSVETVKDSNSTNYKLQFDVTDTVSFGTQEYNSKDGLYFKIGASLCNYDNGSISSATGFPAGISGDIKFYVSIDNTYYSWVAAHQESGALVAGKWVKSSDDDPVAVPVKSWHSNGEDASLVLSDADGAPIDLEGIRTLANNAGRQFKIRVTAAGGSLTMSEPACQAGIAVSNEKDTGLKHTKISYRSTLSSYSDKLNTSSMTVVNEGVRGYYRTKDDSASKISLTANLTSQLGINVDDLKSADGTIALTGRYDFSEAKEGASNLASADKVTYTLTLQKRDENEDSEGHPTYTEVGGDISRYITVVDNDQGLTPVVNGSSIVFTDSKGNSGKFATRDGDSLALVLGFRIKVNTDVEAEQQFYSNYRLVLAAHLTGGGVDDTPDNAQNLTGYDNSDYVTYTLTRVNTGGINH